MNVDAVLISCLRTAVITLIIIALSFAVFVGILIADKNTRDIGYSNQPPIINVTQSDGRFSLSIMDYEIVLSDDAVRCFGLYADMYKKSAPSEVKASSALMGIIKMIVDRFLR